MAREVFDFFRVDMAESGRPSRLLACWGWRNVDPFEPKNYCWTVKVRDIVKLIEKDGWYWVRTKGSHHQYKHQTRPGLVTVPGNPGNEVAAGTLNNILKQAGLKP